MEHDDLYEAPAVEERVEVDVPLSLVSSSDGGPKETPIWRRRGR